MTTAATPGLTPHEQATNKKPNLVNLPEWGQVVWVKTNPQSKLDTRAEELHWVGFNENTKDGHWIYWLKKSIVTVEHNVKFAFDAKTVNVLVEGEHKPVAACNMLPIVPIVPTQLSAQPPAPTPALSKPTVLRTHPRSPQISIFLLFSKVIPLKCHREKLRRYFGVLLFPCLMATMHLHCSY
jgi:hypothetical protein